MSCDDGRRAAPGGGAVEKADVADQISVLGFAGSLRRGSYNNAALRAALELAPAGMTIETFDLAPIQPYNEDVKEEGFPPPEQEFREKIRAADALLIVTPEYNRSMSGVLKNAIDWASRPPDQPFNGKPTAIFGASPGMIGTAVAQYDLRRCLGVLNALVMNTPSVMIGNAAEKFDQQGRLTDQPTRELIAKLLVALVDWTHRCRA
jgi:chromate reductase